MERQKPFGRQLPGGASFRQSLAAVFNLAYGELQKVMGLRKSRSDGLPQALMANIKRALSRGQAEEATKLARTVTFLATTANTAAVHRPVRHCLGHHGRFPATSAS